jgi:hypothetical protein
LHIRPPWVETAGFVRKVSSFFQEAIDSILLA